MFSPHEENLRNQLSQAVDLDWLKLYFELASVLIKMNQLGPNDPRLVCSTTNSGHFLPITIGQRVVLCGRRNDWPIDLICGRDIASLSDLHLGQSYQYKLASGEVESPNVPPIMVHISGRERPNQDLLYGPGAWIDSIEYELIRSHSARVREHHNPAYYRSIVDMEYRKFLFDEVTVIAKG